MFSVKTQWNEYEDCVLLSSRYATNDHISVCVYSFIDGPIASITVNLPEVANFPKNFSFVDTNNFPEAEDLIYELGIGKVTQYRCSSGFCVYPLYEFDEEVVKEYVELGRKE